MTSLKAKLSWSVTLSLFVLLTFQFIVVSFAIREFTHQQITDRLEREAEHLLATLTVDNSKLVHLAETGLSVDYKQPYSGHYFAIFSDEKQLYSKSLWDFALPLNKLKAGKSHTIYLAGPNAQRLLIFSRGYQKHDTRITVAVAEDLSPIQSNINRFQLIYAVISGIGLLVLWWLQKTMVTRALLPLQKIQQNIAKLSQGESNYLDSEGPDEILPLIREINRLLLGMDRKYQRSRESLGNLAHALKTKLAVLNQITESPQIKKHKQIQSSIYEATTALNQIIERELKRARLLGDTRPGRKVDIKSVIVELTTTFQQIYVAKGINISCVLKENPQFFCDKEDFVEMMGNLLDNACKWAKQQVVLTVVGGRVFTIIVEDDGEGARDADYALLTQRGYRIDESKPGSGLGLAIVSDIVESYNGTLSFGKSAALGGLKVEVSFSHATITSHFA